MPSAHPKTAGPWAGPWHCVPCVAAAAWGMVAAVACGFPDVGFYPADDGATSIDSGGRDPAVGSGNGSEPSANDLADLADAADATEEGGTGAAAPPRAPNDASVLQSDSSGGIVGDGSGTEGGSVGATSSSGGAGDGGGTGSSSGSSSGGSGGSSGGGGMMCNCSPSQLYSANVSCGGVIVTALNLGLLCNQTSGFVGSDPGCGHSGTFITCTADLSILACTATMSTVVQQCH